MNGKVARKVDWDQTVKGYTVCLQVQEFCFSLVMVSQQHFFSKEVTWLYLNIRAINSCHNAGDGLGRKKIDTELFVLIF